MDFFGRKAKEKAETLARDYASLQMKLKDAEAERESLHKRLIDANAEILELDNISIQQNQEMIRMTTEREQTRQKIRELTEKVGMYEDQMQDADMLKKIIRHKEEQLVALREELETERHRADRYADFAGSAMDSGFQPIPEESMLAAGFEKTDDGYAIPPGTDDPGDGMLFGQRNYQA